MKSSIINSALTFLAAIILCSCEKGIFLMDPVDPQIIQYTEDGNDAAGALINGELWKSVLSENLFGGFSYNPRVISLVDDDSLIIIFEGYIERSDDDLEFVKMEFYLGGISIESTDKLIELDNRIFEFDGQKHVGLVDSDVINPGLSYDGQIYFRKVTKDHFCGTFSIKMGTSTIVTYGRFDYKMVNLSFEVD